MATKFTPFAKVPNLRNFKVAILVTDGFEETELTEPEKALRDAGAQVDIISEKTEIQGFKHHDKTIKILASRGLENARACDYDALMLPGGALNADQLRADPLALEFVREIQNAGKPIAAICHGAWTLISAGLVKGRTLTSYHTIKDDIINAGGNWVDQPVVLDTNWVTSRKPDDLPEFNQEMIHLFSRSTPSIIQVAESA